MDYMMSPPVSAHCSSAKQAADLAAASESLCRKQAEHRAILESGAQAALKQNDLLKKQVELLQEQNETLAENYNKLQEIYDSQKRATEEAREDLHRSRVFNRWMMGITVVSMLAAIAGPIISILW